MLVALRRAGIANLSAELAKFRVELRAAAHEGGGHPADVSAINTEPGALLHAAETFVAAMLAFLRATHASFDTGLMILMCYLILSLVCWLLQKEAFRQSHDPRWNSARAQVRAECSTR